ncbi:MAG TPA: FkbM family methyltransferase [Saprospiraceae bacterium]|nr:FkbM family methyltransferase [Saprospiraceae bacterium]HRG19649.1 FkbM family methyltransferase [Saprospiraceae bacterium]
MNRELSFFLFFTRKFPNWAICRILVNRVIAPLYNRKKRNNVVAKVHGFNMQLEPSESIDSGLLFFPQYFDYRELEAICGVVSNEWTILDIGSHIGFYSLYLSNKVSLGKIFAFEADPTNFRKLQNNLKLNPEISNVGIVNVGVSDKSETLSLGLNTSGNKSGNSFLSNSNNRIEVICKPLLDLLFELSIQKVNLIKIDIEGFEYRVLRQYLKDAPYELLADWILIEDNPTISQEGNTIELLIQHNYVMVKNFGLNKLMKRGN